MFSFYFKKYGPKTKRYDGIDLPLYICMYFLYYLYLYDAYLLFFVFYQMTDQVANRYIYN